MISKLIFKVFDAHPLIHEDELSLVFANKYYLNHVPVPIHVSFKGMNASFTQIVSKFLIFIGSTLIKLIYAFPDDSRPTFIFGHSNPKSFQNLSLVTLVIVNAGLVISFDIF